MRKQFSSWRVSKLWDLWEKIGKWLIKSCTVRMCCKCYSPILTLKGKYLPFGNDDRSSNDCASPGTSCMRNVPRAQGASVHKHKQVIIWTLCPTGMGVAGVDVVVVSIQELLLSDDRPDCVVLFWSRTLKWPLADSTGAVSVGRSVRCAMQWEVPYSQEL